MLTEKEIKNACKEVRKHGWTITDGLYLAHEEKKCCPLSALAMYRLGLQSISFAVNGSVLVSLLREDRIEVLNFIDGFDALGRNIPKSCEIHSNLSFSMGKKIRRWALKK